MKCYWVVVHCDSFVAKTENRSDLVLAAGGFVIQSPA